MAIGIILPEDVLAAIDLLDNPVEGPRLVKQLHYGPARSYRLLYNGRFYDSKPVVGIAHGVRNGGTYLSSRDFTGGASGAAQVLTRLGFYVDNKWLYAISQLRVDRTHGRPAAYQYVVLLWAISRVHSDLPRMARFNEVRDELAELLQPFALAQTPPDPLTPWLALARSGTEPDIGLWDRQLPPDGVPQNESTVRSFNLAGGLSSEFYRDLRPPYYGIEYQHFARAAVDFIATLIGEEPAFLPLVEHLGLTERTSDITEPDDAPEVVDAIAAVEALGSPRRKFGRRFTPAENRAIEQRAVTVARDHFEHELGFATEDVGATRSYDIHATKDDRVVKVEVKGTTGDGRDVVLTRNEVRLHVAEHPNNAFAVVRKIVLERGAEPPIATGGELSVSMPWAIDIGRLEPIAYTYRTGLEKA
jgi:hypothetical protein